MTVSKSVDIALSPVCIVREEEGTGSGWIGVVPRIVRIVDGRIVIAAVIGDPGVNIEVTLAVSVAQGVVTGNSEVGDVDRLVAVAVVEHDTLCAGRNIDDELLLAVAVDGLFRHGVAGPRCAQVVTVCECVDIALSPTGVVGKEEGIGIVRIDRIGGILIRIGRLFVRIGGLLVRNRRIVGLGIVAAANVLTGMVLRVSLVNKIELDHGGVGDGNLIVLIDVCRQRIVAGKRSLVREVQLHIGRVGYGDGTGAVGIAEEDLAGRYDNRIGGIFNGIGRIVVAAALGYVIHQPIAGSEDFGLAFQRETRLHVSRVTIRAAFAGVEDDHAVLKSFGNVNHIVAGAGVGLHLHARPCRVAGVFVYIDVSVNV